MFADPIDLADLASSAFDEVISSTLQEAPSTATTTKKGSGGSESTADTHSLLSSVGNMSGGGIGAVLSPWEYRFAYLTVFGTMPSEADIQLVYELDGRGSLLHATAPVRPSHPTSLLQDKLTYLSTQQHRTHDRSVTWMTKDRFVRRMHDKHVALYGPFVHKGHNGPKKMPLLWSVFDSVDVDAKGYFTLDDLRRAAATVIGGGGDQGALDRMVGMCEQAFIVADEDRDGRVYFDRFEWMTTQV